MKKIVYFFAFFALIVLVVLGRNFFLSKRELHNKYHFTISKISENAKGHLTLYDGDKKYFFINYYFYKTDGLEIGDLISKNDDSITLKVYRFNNKNGKFELFLIKKPR